MLGQKIERIQGIHASVQNGHHRDFLHDHHHGITVAKHCSGDGVHVADPTVLSVLDVIPVLSHPYIIKYTHGAVQHVCNSSLLFSSQSRSTCIMVRHSEYCSTDATSHDCQACFKSHLGEHSRDYDFTCSGIHLWHTPKSTQMRVTC